MSENKGKTETVSPRRVARDDEAIAINSVQLTAGRTNTPPPPKPKPKK